MYTYMYVYIYVYIYTYMYTYMYVYIYIYVYHYLRYYNYDHHHSSAAPHRTCPGGRGSPPGASARGGPGRSPEGRLLVLVLVLVLSTTTTTTTTTTIATATTTTATNNNNNNTYKSNKQLIRGPGRARSSCPASAPRSGGGPRAYFAVPRYISIVLYYIVTWLYNVYCIHLSLSLYIYIYICLHI